MKENEDGSETFLKIYSEGEMFGELALIYNCNRTATITTISEESCVFSLDRQVFNHIISNNTLKRNEKHMKMLTKVPILKTLDHNEKSKILDACQHVEFCEGDYVITEGEVGEEFYILLEGEAIATKVMSNCKSTQVVKEYKAGDYFGERALMKNTTRAANIIAKSDIKCLALKREDFKHLLGPIEEILKRNMKIYINFLN